MIRAYSRSLPGADKPGDDWSGITDPVLRRKLQNRCNQRAARRRKLAALHEPAPYHELRVRERKDADARQPEPQSVPPSLALLLLQRASGASRWLPTLPALDGTPSSICDESSDDGSGDAAERLSARSTFASIRRAQNCSPRLAYAMTLQQIQTHSNKLYPLPADHLLSLIYYNVYRGLLQNIAILGLDLDLMTTDEYPSPFLPMSPSASSAIASLPPQLMPTRLQKTMAHHPQWDIFPCPRLRDNALNYGEDRIDDLELCLDMVGSQSRLQGGSSDEAGVYIWGEPWQIDSWEVTESLLRKYHWLFKGSKGIEKSTNRWRRERGVAEVDFDEVVAEAERLSLVG